MNLVLHSASVVMAAIVALSPSPAAEEPAPVLGPTAAIPAAAIVVATFTYT